MGLNVAPSAGPIGCLDCAHPWHEMTCQFVLGGDPENGPAYCPCAVQIERMELEIVRLRAAVQEARLVAYEVRYTDGDVIHVFARLTDRVAAQRLRARLLAAHQAADADGCVSDEDWSADAEIVIDGFDPNGPLPEKLFTSDAMSLDGHGEFDYAQLPLGGGD